VITTGAVFDLITLAHIARVFAEQSQSAGEPWFILMTVAAAVLSVWAVRLVWRTPRS
jgi:hypothetical protein